ncbi:MAG: exonuclease SbcCD subunit D C-terminal domain-containing protein, partial [Plesiomonas sp.]|nr:exonuclease SbcCD subunit D C-terminal domain-containing protein [Plesiomonas sp.]
VSDKTIPPAEAVSLFDDFLCQLAQRKQEVFIISGNHDSAERLAFGGRLLDASGVHLAPVYNGAVSPIVLHDALGPVYFWMLPFLKPALIRRFFPDTAIESHTDACRAALEQMPMDPAQRNVLLTHQFVTGSITCESEQISVGGTDNVDAALFSDFDYVALGHIHSPQNIGSPRIRYCGTPLKYSFSECGQQKSVTVAELGDKGELLVRTVPLVPLHDLRQLRGTYAQLTDRSFYQGTAVADYLHIILTDEADVPEAMARLRVIYPNLMKLTYDNTRTRTSRQLDWAVDVQKKEPLDLFTELYEQQNNQPLSQIQRNFLTQLIQSIQEGSL